MALISSKNLVAPLTNKIHITTIILVAMVFTVFRFAGGGVDVRSKLNNRLREDKKKLMVLSPSTHQQKASDESILDVFNKKELPPQEKPANKVVPPWERNKPAQPSNDNEEATSLDDIRRMLDKR